MELKIVIVIPVYYNRFSTLEKISLQQCRKVFANYQKIFVIPENLSIENDLLCEDIECVTVPAAWMDSIESYSRMMCSEEFYQKFESYDWMLIYQLDAFAFSDQLSYFCNLGYDYYGAPWLEGAKIWNGRQRVTVGNGGFSLRKIAACLRIAEKKQYICGEEDAWYWADSEHEGFKLAPMDIALQFSFELDVRRCYYMNECQLPFGCHAWWKLDMVFWKPFIEKEGYVLDHLNETCELEWKHWITWNIGAEILNECTGLNQYPCETIYIWGTKGEGFECGYLLKRIGKKFEYIDSNKAKEGKTLWGEKIHVPDVLTESHGNSVIIIAAAFFEKEINEQIKSMDIQNVTVSYSDMKRKIESYIQNHGYRLI